MDIRNTIVAAVVLDEFETFPTYTSASARKYLFVVDNDNCFYAYYLASGRFEQIINLDIRRAQKNIEDGIWGVIGLIDEPINLRDFSFIED